MIRRRYMASINNATANAREKKMGKINNAAIYDVDTLISAGIDPKTGLPRKASNAPLSANKVAIKRVLRIIDEQDAVNRYTWFNLPLGMSSEDLERLIYYKGQLAFFYLEGADQFYIMPYALDGGIDFYGRFNSVHPVPFSEGTSDEDKKRFAEQRNYLSTLKLNCIYDVVEPENITYDVLTHSCVLLHDYTPQLSQTITPRWELQDGILDIMSDLMPFMRTALLNGTGVQGMRVNSEDEESNVTAASNSINRAALNGEKWMAITAALELQELTGGEVAKAEEFLLAMQGMDNFRLSMYGIDNGGLFEKKAHTLQSEQDMNRGNTGLIFDDGLARRQRFCDICNSIWDIGIWCEPGESVMGVDINGDGIIADEQDQSGTMQGEQPQEVIT
ncbi:MAG: hypothetical protein NC127_08925 [Muribaculum sp.]|nr:hypothetical protein [Muribaculum sp.]